MLSKTEDFVDLGQLVSFAVQPTMRPGRNPEYRRVLARYRTEIEFRNAADAVLYGMGAHTLSDGDLGLVLGIEPESPFAFRLSDLPNTSTRDGQLLSGLVLMGLAAWAFPTPSDLDDERVRRLTETEVEEWLRATCERCRTRDAAGESIPETGLDEAWRVYLAMPALLTGDRGREAGTGRLSPRCTAYWIRAILSWMRDQGMARVDQAGGDGTWTLTDRFRVQVKDMAAERAFTFFAELARENLDTMTSEAS